MSTIAELLQSIATNSGIDTDDLKLKELVMNPALNVNVPDDIANKIQSSLMTEDQAKTNPNIKKYFTALSLNPVDSTINEILATYSDLGDDVKSRFVNEKNSYTKIKMLVDTLKEIESKKQTATGGEKSKLVDQIAALNAEIVKVKAEQNDIVSQTEQRYINKMSDIALTSHLRSYTYGTGLADDVNIIAAKTLINEALQNKKASVKLNDAGKFELYSTDDPSLPYTENHKPVEFKTFTDKILADNKLLKVTAPVTPVTPIQQPAGGYGTGSGVKAQIERMKRDAAQV
jgi:hypothetical protein